MASVPQRRKVLLLKDEPSIRKLFVLVNRLESEDAPDGNGESSLAGLNHKHYLTTSTYRYPR